MSMNIQLERKIPNVQCWLTIILTLRPVQKLRFAQSFDCTVQSADKKLRVDRKGAQF